MGLPLYSDSPAGIIASFANLQRAPQSRYAAANNFLS
jgi:hypothetical protein